MKNTDIIRIDNEISEVPAFTNEHLAKATKRIAAIYNDALKYEDSKNREIAKILADVADKKSYTDDGFSSVADYANTVFGIARQNAYALANAGKIYNDKEAPAGLKAFSPSKLAEVASVEPEILIESVNSGAISAATTQKDLRDFANMVKDNPERVKILKYYTPSFCISSQLANEIFPNFTSLKMTIEDLDTFISARIYDRYIQTASGEIEIFKLPKRVFELGGKKTTVQRKVYFNGSFSVVVEFYPANNTSAKDPSDLVQMIDREEENEEE